jgi:ABC-2 type transport system ATP-binding protein
LIHVALLTKSFGPVRALDRVSFEVGEGEVLGFLGPNGAGKTTTLRILTGFLPLDSGTVTVAGHDVRTRSLQVRRSIGYLPEGVPLYPEMRVGEYLRFRARLKGVARGERKRTVARSLERAGVSDVERRIVGTLSRGYRQRVGLADALLGSPRLLILDEPTVGLDPEQLRQFRSLLRELGKEHTVILSTHILSEVEQVANRVVIIARGRIAAEDTAANLRRRIGALDRVRAEIAGPPGAVLAPEAMARELAGLPEVETVRAETAEEAETAAGSPARDGGGEPAAPSARAGGFSGFTIRPRHGSDPREAVFRLARDRGWRLRELTQRPVSLEEVFLEIVGEGGGGQGPRQPQAARTPQAAPASPAGGGR